MKRKIRSLMTGLSDVPVVDENSTLFEAILEIGMVRDGNASALKCPAALVIDANGNVAGFLHFHAILLGLEPRYAYLEHSVGVGSFHPGWIRSELEKFGLWEDAQDEICRKACDTVIKSLMTVPDQSQITDADASINEAMYQMVVTGRDYLFVRSGDKIAGVISLSDVMKHICEVVKACRV